eukprot:CAMPEP_0195111986 /NCGR_PEP_ID=MMETSP0448-20130528/97877_1 /TAXON_ID=66468 /ORGANISM="Heterocapsa triquestra, Strain CCMP 448" /LENGTH=45 /DNA_ID= /DNA_START= /DNA_END= /DNA_ORIENTATION=
MQEVTADGAVHDVAVVKDPLLNKTEEPAAHGAAAAQPRVEVVSAA